MSMKLLRLQKVSVSAKYDLPTYENAKGSQLAYGLTMSIGHVESVDWPTSLTVKYTATVVGDDGKPIGDAPVIDVEIVYRLAFDSTAAEGDEGVYESNKEAWPYCRNDLVDILRDFPVAIGQLPWSMPELAKA